MPRGSRLRHELLEEFPFAESSLEDVESRRNFLKVMGASMALAGAAGCDSGQPAEKIVAHVRTPEQGGRGKPLQYATTAPLDGHGTGILVTSHNGRPTKIEGNPEHPASGGASDAILQSHTLSLYDPDRSQAVSTGGTIASWNSFRTDLRSQLAEQAGRKGAGLRILSGPVSSPTLIAQRERLLRKFPEAKWYEYSALDRSGVRAGCELLFGQPLEPVYHLARADVVLSLDADLFGTMPGNLRHSSGFAQRRRITDDDGHAAMSRLYAVESTWTTFGAAADHRRAVEPAAIHRIAAHIARRLGIQVSENEIGSLPAGIDGAFLDEVTNDLQGYRLTSQAAGGGALVVAGEFQAAEVHALVQAINHALGAVGTTVSYIPPVTGASGFGELRQLVGEMQDGAVDTLLILEKNPVQDAPAELGFRSALGSVRWRARHGLYQDETSAECNWHLPASHFLEEWSDARSIDGTASIVQPLIAPLYDGRSVHTLIDALVEEVPRREYEIVRDYWKKNLGDDGFEAAWQTALHDGVVADSAPEPVEVEPREGALASLTFPGDSQGLTLVIRPDPYLLDGRFANNAWLQELPRPFTSLTWGNALQLSPFEFDQVADRDGDLVEVQAGKNTVTLPAVRVPGLPHGVATVHLGYGRRRAGRVGTDVGVDITTLLPPESGGFVRGAQLTRSSGRHRLAVTQLHHQITSTPPGSFVENSIVHRNLVRGGSVAEWNEHPDDPQFMHVDHHTIDQSSHQKDLPSFYPVEEPADYEPHEWGMQIDLTQCIGCNACVVACQSENNIPTVGRDQVLVGREMHWIRVDTYFEGSAEHPRIAHQPVTCMHCEHAPCEPVCPVAATTHSDEGLNEMTYNRCVGTRYCSNNCPYKVRRFNFFEYNDELYSGDLPVLNLLPNPNVTVRSRGVMEKCTYCVQRISTARIDAQIHGDGVIPDGEMVTACQQSCPTKAIVFGNIADPESAVSSAKASPLDYVLLEELNTRPRTSYAARLTNPNPRLAEAEGHGRAHREH
ncbi:MAG: 4Fe-4S dicluster domain-containing protein [Planctomycetaceae bacterium]|nr:4Fe-4S dicluster domain-containing protein [Planctomycetaceae bacterium]